MLNSDMFSAGSARCLRPSSVRKLIGMPSTSTVWPRPLEGSQPSCTENSMISIRPTQNEGSEKPRIENPMIARPARPPLRRPAHRPSGTPISTDSTSAVTASSSVAGRRCAISVSAGVEYAKERPRSPATAFCRNRPYCTHMGLSRPKAATVAARSACVASGLIRMSTGLPMAYMPTNTSSDMTSRTNTLCSTRRTTKAIMARDRGQRPPRQGLRRAPSNVSGPWPSYQPGLKLNA